MNNKLLGLIILSAFFSGHIISTRANDPVITNRPFVYYCNSREAVEVVPQTNTNGGQAVPEALFIDSGDYRFENRTYRLDKEGLYRFFFWAQPMKAWQRIVYRKNPDALLTALSWMGAHGCFNRADPESLRKIALDRKVLASPLVYARFAVDALARTGITARVVHTLTMREWNSYDNTHSLVEVFRPDEKQWAVYDLLYGYAPRAEGRFLTIVEWCDRVQSGKPYELERIGGGINVAVGEYGTEAWDPGLFFELRASSETALREWHRRVLCVPMIESGGKFYFFDDAERKRIEKYSADYLFLDRREFMKMFYEK